MRTLNRGDFIQLMAELRGLLEAIRARSLFLRWPIKLLYVFLVIAAPPKLWSVVRRLFPVKLYRISSTTYIS